MFNKTKNIFSTFIKSGGGNKLFAVVKVLLAGALIFFLIKTFNVKLQHFSRVDWRFVIAAGAVMLLQYAFIALRWCWILKSFGINVPYSTALSLTMQGMFFMLFLPGGTVSADVCKAALTAGKSVGEKKAAAAFTVIVDRVCGLAGLLLVSLAAVAIVIFAAQHGSCSELLMNDFFLWLLKSFSLAGIILILAIMLFFWGGKLLKTCLPNQLFLWLDDRSGSLLSSLAQGLLWNRQVGLTVGKAIVFSALVTFPLLILAVYLIACGVSGSSDAAISGSMLAGTMGELVGVLPLTPGSIGVRDVISVNCFQACGISKDTAVLIPLVYTALMFITGSIGGLFALHMLFCGKKTNS